MRHRILMAELEVVTASSDKLFHLLQNSGVSIRNLVMTDELTVCFEVQAIRIGFVKRLLSKYGFEYRILSDRGLLRYLTDLRKRPILVIGMVCLMFLTLYLPTRVLFVRVKGTEKIDPKIVLQSAELCGIRFGASRREVRSEQVKNSLLRLMPELKWAGIDTYGCTAVISVTERQQGYTDPQPQVSDIVASEDGIICELTVTRGSALCSPGEFVEKGQVLITGSSDLGLTVLKQRAQAEIYAMTTHNVEAIYMPPSKKNDERHDGHNGYTLLFGKKLIKLVKCSGNSGVTCGKLYKQSYIQLPGGFELPVALITVSLFAADQKSETVIAPELLLQKYLLSQMVAGEILDSESMVQDENDLSILNCTYYCREMIGKEVEEELLPEYE